MTGLEDSRGTARHEGNEGAYPGRGFDLAVKDGGFGGLHLQTQAAPQAELTHPTGAITPRNT